MIMIMVVVVIVVATEIYSRVEKIGVPVKMIVVMLMVLNVFII